MKPALQFMDVDITDISKEVSAGDYFVNELPKEYN